MERKRKKRRREDKAAPDLTPMIDVTFQLLIFFILVTRFKTEERDHRADLPKQEGMDDNPAPPREQVTIYCQWDASAGTNSYVVALDARGRVPVPESYAALDDLVIFPSDNAEGVIRKKQRYKGIFDNLVQSIEDYITRSGARVEKIEISFAVNAADGARSGTAPWMFVSLALDAATRVNMNREQAGKSELPVTFKFADALGAYD
jgi:biopolymer transport protein ExbD